ncbi:MAG: hypothetical protein KDI36_08345, partial [Pseudomonadales bacterium]|nr:hypothetical protein [Pseudomonadales bacterium]
MNNKKVLTSLIKLPLICMVAALVIAAALVFLSTRSTIADEVTATLIDQRMQNLQFLTNRRQDDLMSQARTISNSARLSRLLETGTQDELSEEEARIRATIPYAIRVRLFRIGQARVERDAIPPFTFTSLDLVNEVETGNSVFPEAINANGRWLISLATPVTPPNDNRLRGTMFVYLDLASVTDMLQGDHQGRVSLIQKFPTGPETEILSMGEAGSLPESRISLSNPNWQIAFSANDSLAHDGGGLLSHLIPVITLFLISTIGVVFSLIRVSQQLSEDASLYIHQISDLASDLYKPHQGYHFGVFDELDSELSRLGPAPAATTPMLEPGALQLGSATTAALTPDEGLAEPENTDLMAEVDDLLADEEPTVSAPVPEADAADLATIFRAYDIRGIVGKTLTPDVIRRIGMALGTEAQDIGEHTLLVAADGRLSSPGVSTALIDGITATG